MRKLIGAIALGGLMFAGAARAEKKPKPAPLAGGHVGVTTRVFHPKDKRNWRGDEQQDLRCTVWYPALDTAVETQQVIEARDPVGGAAATAGAPASAALFDAGIASPNAQFAPSLDKFPLVLLSHGAGGSALQMAWLGTALARAGFIAVAVDHPGNNSNAKLTPEGMALWWERATDLTDVLNGMLAEESFAPHIDASRVAATGYSLGGYTVMELAGARTDISEFFDLCKAKPDTDVCHVPEMRGMGSAEDVLHAARATSGLSLAASGDSYRDPRVKAVFAIAPALGFTLTDDSLKAIRLPVEIVVGKDDRTAPAQDNADWIRQNVRGARESVLPGVAHDTFLDTCTARGARDLGRYCEDPSGTERAAVHSQVAAMAVEFFDRALRY
jgi:predicted dienelactone hydrolase